jgi:ubiquinone/menaquinone biosynthesis C-methylase UbiE
MGIQHYFLNDEDKRAKFIFNLIAPVYHLIDKGTEKDFEMMAELLNRHYPLAGKSVLDVGCGTGSWISALSKYDLKYAAGADFSEKMITVAKKRVKGIDCFVQNGQNLDMFDDNSFDVVTATFVLHGMKKDKRAIVLKEMKRVAKEIVVIHDFYDNRQFAVQLLEFLERSDFKNFQKNFKNEIPLFFDEYEIIKGENDNALYVGIVSR